MNVLVIGNGGREHALAWKLSQSRDTEKIYAAPGNGGTASLGANLPINDLDIPALLSAAREHAIGMTVVGPEAPLAAGIVDAFEAEGLPIFGPSKAAARIESSKAWAKEFMARHGIPTAAHRAVTSLDEADAYLSTVCTGPVAVKADGLAAGKGVVMAADKAEAILAVKSMLDGRFGESGSTVVLEEALTGLEVSVFAFVDGPTVSAEVAACDYKRVGDGDTGPNTGGMGAYTPPEFWTPELALGIRENILEPAARGMAAEGCPFKGILYAGLMITPTGPPKVIEFNCRLGDPDGSLVLPRLESDLLDICVAVSEGRLADTVVSWSNSSYVSVVMASGGYPGSYETGKTISGVDDAGPGVLIFHAGTNLSGDGKLVTSGGRVLAAVASGANAAEARRGAYAAVEKISFEDAIYRRDIGKRAATSAASIGG
ncbi:MAG: phosphoribosylamine--glycine ligase [Chloroflexi bacterium]|nr:phosphoribosylamine--glycine ligase [Chloroflexota bacterium]